MGGVILDFVLASANETDLKAGSDILFEQTDLDVMGDKAYINADLAQQLSSQNRLRLQTIPRKNQKKTVA